MGYAQLLPFPEILGHITVEEQEEQSDEQEDLHQHSLYKGVFLLFFEYYSSGGYKEMSWLSNSALIYEPNEGEGGLLGLSK
jgi:hypothetical protein